MWGPDKRRGRRVRPKGLLQYAQQDAVANPPLALDRGSNGSLLGMADAVGQATLGGLLTGVTSAPGSDAERAMLRGSGGAVMDMTPGVGDVKALAYDAPRLFGEGHPVMGGIAAASAIPLLGMPLDVVRAMGNIGRATDTGGPLGEAARRARAVAMGFDIDKPVYRGSRDIEHDPGRWMAEDPEYASLYAKGDMANVTPYVVRGDLLDGRTSDGAARLAEIGDDLVLSPDGLPYYGDEWRIRNALGFNNRPSGVVYDEANGRTSIKIGDTNNVRPQFDDFAEGAPAHELLGVDDVPDVGALNRPRGITAYHGSPHDFDKFSLDAIGTGEGAQAYGHGLYFAENEGVARWYRDNLAMDVADIKVTGDAPDGAIRRVRQSLQNFTDRGGMVSPSIVEDVIKDLETSRDVSQRFLETDGFDKVAYSNFSTTVDALDALRRGDISIDPPNPGRMYEVNINADPDDFLDWDAPLSQQPPKVRDALGRIMESQPTLPLHAMSHTELREALEAMDRNGNYRTWEDTGEVITRPELLEIAEGMRDEDPEAWAEYFEKPLLLPDQPGKGIYHQLTSAGIGHPNVAAATGRDGLLARVKSMAQDGPLASHSAASLREAGIPGIRYLDGNSRGVGEGTRNYVLFDDSLVDIIRKYGLAGLLGGGVAARQQQDRGLLGG